MSDQIRDAFEAWYIQRQRSRGYGEMLTDAEFLRRMPNGRYMSLGLEDAFAAYQASRLAALEESQPKWLPIETAPRDGTWILVAGPDQTGAGRMVCRMVAEAWGWESADDGYGAYIQPTHWMALPANPTTERPAALKE